MKIREIRFTTVSVPFIEPEIWSGGSRPGVTSVIVEVETDDGLTGIGEALPAPSVEVTLAALGNMRDLVVGEDPLRIEHLTHRILSMGGFYAFPTMANAAWGGIEMALWDLAGKSVNRPVHTLFGGSVRDEVPFMYFVQRKALDEIQQDARRAVAAGFGTVYTKVGLDFESDVAVVKALREAIGRAVQLRVDANEAWTPGTALRILEQMKPYDLQYIEQPTRMSDIETLKWLRQRTTVPIAANQSSWTNKDLFQVLAAGAADVVMTDPHQAGGLLAFKKAAGIAEAAGVPIVFHSFGPLAITTYAAMQVIASSSNFLFDNQTYNHMLADDVVADIPKFERGCLRLPQAPGIGVRLDPDKVARYAEVYSKRGYLSAYDTEGTGFAEQKRQAGTKILWFPNQ
ncbi:MAG: mandelate racemase/muconate lactonizing enzyme family protein [Bryobacteraceae bacterium]